MWIPLYQYEIEHEIYVWVKLSMIETLIPYMDYDIWTNDWNFDSFKQIKDLMIWKIIRTINSWKFLGVLIICDLNKRIYESLKINMNVLWLELIKL